MRGGVRFVVWTSIVCHPTRNIHHAHKHARTHGFMGVSTHPDKHTSTHAHMHT